MYEITPLIKICRNTEHDTQDSLKELLCEL